MKKIILATLIGLGLSGCVVYPVHHYGAHYADPVYSAEGRVYYEGAEYYYDSTPVIVGGVSVISLYYFDGHGHRHYRYVNHDKWHPVHHH